MNQLTLGELRAALKDYPDETPVFISGDNGTIKQVRGVWIGKIWDKISVEILDEDAATSAQESNS